MVDRRNAPHDAAVEVRWLRCGVRHPRTAVRSRVLWGRLQVLETHHKYFCVTFRALHAGLLAARSRISIAARSPKLQVVPKTPLQTVWTKGPCCTLELEANGGSIESLLTNLINTQ